MKLGICTGNVSKKHWCNLFQLSVHFFAFPNQCGNCGFLSAGRHRSLRDWNLHVIIMDAWRQVIRMIVGRRWYRHIESFLRLQQILVELESPYKIDLKLWESLTTAVVIELVNWSHNPGQLEAVRDVAFIVIGVVVNIWLIRGSGMNDVSQWSEQVKTIGYRRTRSLQKR